MYVNRLLAEPTAHVIYVHCRHEDYFEGQIEQEIVWWLCEGAKTMPIMILQLWFSTTHLQQFKARFDRKFT